MPDTRCAVFIALMICACDPPTDHTDRIVSSAPADVPTSDASGNDLGTAFDDASSGLPSDDTTTGQPDDDADETTGTGSDGSTGIDTFPPTTTSHFDHTTGGEDTTCEVDVVLSIDAAAATRWALVRLGNQVIVADAHVRDAGVHARWIVIPWVDTVGAVDTLEGWSSDVDAYAASPAVQWYSVFNGGVQVAPSEGIDEDPEVGAGLDALATAAAWDGWRPDAARWVVHVASSAIVEPPSTPGGFPAANTYEATLDALTASQVRVLAWSSVGAPGYDVPHGDAPALSYAWHDLAPESGVPAVLPPEDSGFAAAMGAAVGAGSCVPVPDPAPDAP